MATKSSKITASEFSNFLSALELEWIRVMQVNVDAHQPEPNPAENQLEIGGEGSFQVVDDRIQASHLFRIVFRAKENQKEVGKIEVRYVLSFESSLAMDDPLIKKAGSAFVRHQIPFIVWPYFREFVHAMMTRMGWPVFILPLMRARSFATEDEKPPAKKAAKPTPKRTATPRKKKAPTKKK